MTAEFFDFILQMLLGSVAVGISAVLAFVSAGLTFAGLFWLYESAPAWWAKKRRAWRR